MGGRGNLEKASGDSIPDRGSGRGRDHELRRSSAGSRADRKLVTPQCGNIGIGLGRLDFPPASPPCALGHATIEFCPSYSGHLRRLSDHPFEFFTISIATIILLLHHAQCLLMDFPHPGWPLSQPSPTMLSAG